MSFTNRLGTGDSSPGSIVLGSLLPAAGGAIDVDATSSLVLVSTAASTTIDRSAEDTLAVSDDATTTRPFHLTGTSSISVNQAAGSSIRSLTASSPISLTQAATSSVNELSATSDITATQDAHCDQIQKSVVDTLTVTQTAVSQGGNREFDATSALVLSQSALTTAPKSKSATTSITLTSSAIGLGPFLRSVEDTLTLQDSARSGLVLVEADNVLVFIDEGRVAETYELDLSSSLVLISEGSAFSLSVFATSLLDITQTADEREKPRSAETVIDTLAVTAVSDIIRSAISTITLTQLGVVNNVSKLAESSFTLTDIARNISIKVASEEQSLSIDSFATSNIRMFSQEDVLAIVDELHVNRPWYGQAESALTEIELVFDLDTFSFIPVITGLQDSASVIVDTVRTASSLLSFASQAIGSHVRADGTDCTAEDTLSLTDQATLSTTLSAASAIALTQSAAGITGTPVESTLSVSSLAEVNVVRGLSAANVVAIRDSLAYILEDNGTLCSYSPFIGSSSNPDAPTPPPATYTAPGATPGFRLQYPATGMVTDEVILRSPNLGNIDRLAMTRINRETRGGTLIVYADPDWPKVETLLLTFSGLSFQQGQALMTFMENHLGEEIRLIDWEDRLWTGVIVNPQDPLVQDGRGCQYTGSFEFEGEKV